MTSISLVLNILMLLLSLISGYLFYKNIVANNVLKNKASHWYGTLIEEDKKNLLTAKELQNELGKIKKKSPFERLHDILFYSGLLKRYHFLSPSVYIIMNLCMISVVAIAPYILGLLSLKFMIILALFIFITPLFILYLITEKKYVQTQKYLPMLINMLDTFSSTSSDIVDILSQSADHVGEPLYSEMKYCVSRARAYGDISMALVTLSESLEHPMFRSLIKDIELNQRTSSALKKVLNDYRMQAERMDALDKKLRAIYLNGRGELLILLAMGAGIFFLTPSFLGYRESTIEILSGSIVGVFLLIYTCTITLIVLWYSIFQLKK